MSKSRRLPTEADLSSVSLSTPTLTAKKPTEADLSSVSLPNSALPKPTEDDLSGASLLARIKEPAEDTLSSVFYSMQQAGEIQYDSPPPTPKRVKIATNCDTNSVDIDPTEYVKDRCTSWLPWLDDYQESWRGFKDRNLSFTLYDSNSIRDGSFYERFPTLSNRERHLYYMDLFFQMRLYSARKKRAIRTSSKSQAASWNQFVVNFNNNPRLWLSRLTNERKNYVRYTMTGIKMEVHQLCLREIFPCAVLSIQECPMCFGDSLKMKASARSLPI